MEGLKGKTSDFRVLLTPEVLHVIELAGQQQQDGHIFPGVKRGVTLMPRWRGLWNEEGLRQDNMAFAQRCVCG